MTGARYHADQLSTAAALPALSARRRRARRHRGVSIHHLTLNELDVGDFRTFFKLKPPLRSEDDRLAMVEAVADGHDRHHLFDAHAAGRGIEAPALRGRGKRARGAGNPAAAALRLYHAGTDDPAQLIRRDVAEPRAPLRPAGRAPAPARPPTWCCSTPTRPSVLDRFTLRSKSKNTPFDGALLQGRVLGTWVGGERVFDAAEVTA
jgi:dihydroorotase